ncbi:NACHT domain-containing protein [Streptomyces sp. 3214.6]|uniref:NACHT domain-containing protein n=1 Tax=Streptomyces sp. 3214.6 TaxID=1882757 RepID=UPI001E6100B6|nr:NACHT domain-containing protein [Streptomyces sp. 3214.6]
MVMLCAAWVGQALARNQLKPQDTASVIGLLIGTIGVVQSLVALRRRPETDLETAADRLAGWVKNSEGAQWHQLLGGDRVPIDVTFSFHSTESRAASVPSAPSGHLQGVIDDFRATHPRRVVITGGPGAGKTVLATKLLLALLAERTADDPVPVRVALASWDPAVPLRKWLVSRLIQDFDRDPQVARDLVEQGRILPVLDGLDEMDASATPLRDSRAREALRALDAYQDGVEGAPFVLTCRTAFYEDLAAAGHHALDTARIELAPVTATQAHAYLTSRRARHPERWDPILDALRTHPGGALACSLSTPWRLTLAATVYAEAGDPSELLARTSPSELDEHLLARYIPAATQVHAQTAVHYTSSQVHGWLACLARYLEAGADSTAESRGTAGPASELILHRLWPLAGRWCVRAVDAALSLLIFLPGAALFYGQIPQVTSATGKHVAAAGIGAVAFVLVCRAGRRGTPQPAAMRWPRRGTPARRRLAFRRRRVGVMVGLATGLAVGLALVLVPVANSDLTFGGPFGAAVTYAFVLSLTVGLVFGIVAALTTRPGDNAAQDAPDPWGPLRADTLAGALSALAYGATLSLLLGLAEGLAPSSQWLMSALASGTNYGTLVYDPASGFMSGLESGVTYGLALGLLVSSIRMAAGRRYVAFLLCARARLPWRLGDFLAWSCDAGLLRTSGSTYQFRHRELQEWLARHP